MKLFWKIYLLLAATTLVTLVLTIWVSFSVLPAFFEGKRNETLDSFQALVESGRYTDRESLINLADSMGVFIRLVTHDPQQPHPPGALPPLPGEIGERNPSDVRMISLPGGQTSILATARVPGPRQTIFVLFALVLFVSQAAALAIGLRPVFRRTANLTAVTGDFGRGKLSARYPDGSGGDEIDELGRAFNRMADRIISLLDSHNELLNAVAHELRTPMARLGFALELARENPEEVADKLGLMEKDLFQLDTLVSELLEFNRIRNSEPVHEPVSLEDVCVEAADSEGALAPPGIDVLVERPGRAALVHGDRRLLLRAVSNLVRNAVSRASSGVTVAVTSSSDHVSITVEDDGPGFPADFLRNAPRPFQKGDGSCGSGLGLSIVQRIVEKHGGSLSLRNSSRGAVAEIKLPLPAGRPQVCQ